MKILQITSHLNVGGIPRYVLSLTQRLRQQGHRVVVASEGGRMESQSKDSGLEFWRLPFQTSAEFSPQVFWGIRQLIDRLRREPVDIVHAHTRVAQVAAEWVTRSLGIPYVTTWHGIYKRRLGRKLWPCAGERTIAISNPVVEHLREVFRIPEDRIRLVYNGIDTEYYRTPPAESAVRAYRAQWKIPMGKPVVGGVGRLAAGRVKGFDSILVAAYALEDQLPDLQVLIVGDGPRRPFLEDVASRLRIRERVHFVGSVDDVRVPMALMDLFIFPSRWPEAFGLTLVEAMAAGKAVVASRAGAVPEIVQHGEDGWLVESDEPTAMAEGIARLLEDRTLTRTFGRRAQMRARERFDLSRMSLEIEAVYREVLRLPA